MTRQVKPVVITTGRHPFEVLVLLAAIVVGVTLTVTGVEPRSVASAMPGWIQNLWHFLLIAGGAIGLFGIFAPTKLVARLGTEAAGVVVLGSATTMYSIAIFSISGLNALAAGAFVVALALASWTRAYQILRDIRRAGDAAAVGEVHEIPLLVEEDR